MPQQKASLLERGDWLVLASLGMIGSLLLTLLLFFIVVGPLNVSQDTRQQAHTPRELVDRCEDRDVICTTDVKQCPDGSYVSRTGCNCEFAACPGETPKDSQVETLVGPVGVRINRDQPDRLTPSETVSYYATNASGQPVTMNPQGFEIKHSSSRQLTITEQQSSCNQITQNCPKTYTVAIADLEFEQEVVQAELRSATGTLIDTISYTVTAFGTIDGPPVRTPPPPALLVPTDSPITGDPRCGLTNCEFAAADFNQDGLVDLDDYSILVAKFLQVVPENDITDLSGDAFIDLDDYTILASQFSF